jgi:hypothetical protein
VRRSKKDGLDEAINNSKAQNKQNFDYINLEDLLTFVNISLPKILIDVLLTN